MRLSRLAAVLGAVWLVLLAPGAAYAHGFGERYDLPVPLGLYIAGAGATVLFSFVVIGIFAKGVAVGAYPRFNLFRWRLGRALAHPWLLQAAKTLSVLVFLLYLAAGLFGTSDSNSNLAPTLTWIIFWVGLAYFSALVGNIWALINPWKVLFGWVEAAYRRVSGGKALSRHTPYPEGLGMWPAVALFFAFAWVENVYPDSAVPFNLAMLALAYTAVTFGGMFWYGRDTWLRHGEAFSVAFGFLSAFAPTEVRVRRTPGSAGGPVLRATGRYQRGEIVVDREQGREPQPGLVDDYEAYAQAPGEHREWNVRPWGAGLLSAPTPSMSGAVFLLLMLSTVTFDGFAETPFWLSIWTSLYNGLVGVFGLETSMVIKTTALAAFPLVFLGAFALTARLMALGRAEMDTMSVMRAFVYSLLPIALAYHVGHYFSFLLIQGQRIIPLASDPLGLGWDLLGTADYAINIAIVDAGAAWIVNVAAIVIGHIVAVYV
ncbi:MAG: hypothetical protein WD533_02085, partial [Dehalococcoidia bacterium]